MGMFDKFHFAEGVLPDNKVSPEHEFQTKCLSCDLDRYNVDSEGNVRRQPFIEGSEYEEEIKTWFPEYKPINEVVYVYSHVFKYKTPDGDIVDEDERDFMRGDKSYGCDYQEYKIIIKDSKIIYVEKIADRSEVYPHAKKGGDV